MSVVLLVEDEAALLSSLKNDFPWASYGMDTVLCAENAFAALALSREQFPDLLVTDLKMPGMTGLELAKKLLEDPRPLAVIFVSAYSDVPYLKEALQLRAVDYLLKPIDFDELHTAVLHSLDQLHRQYREKGNATLLSAYQQDLKCSVLSALLMRREDHHLLLAQAEAVGLKNSYWSVCFFSRCQTQDEASMKLLAQRRLGPLLTEAFFVSLNEALSALVLETAQAPGEALEGFASAFRLAYPGWDRGFLFAKHPGLQPLYGIGAEVLLEAADANPSLSRFPNSDNLCGQIIDYINAHIQDHALSATTIARDLHYTTSYICAIFKKERNQTIHGYINDVRMETASRLLLETRMKIDQIAQATGYDSESYFCRVFRKKYATNPAKYRRSSS